MFAKLLGIGDLLTAIVIILLEYDLVGWRLALFFSLYLIVKGWAFRSSLISVADILCGVYIFIMIFSSITIVSWIITIYLFQKACFSLAAK